MSAELSQADVSPALAAPRLLVDPSAGSSIPAFEGDLDRFDAFVAREGWHEIDDSPTMVRFLVQALQRFRALDVGAGDDEDRPPVKLAAWAKLHDQFVGTLSDLRMFITEMSDHRDLPRADRSRLIKFADALTNAGRDVGQYTAAMALAEEIIQREQDRPELTEDQRQALLKFRAANGRTWKAALRDCWETGDYRGVEDAGLLQQVRNNLGPIWLRRLSPADLEGTPAPQRPLPEGTKTTFQTLPLGTAFFDPESGEDWIKASSTQARLARPSDVADADTTDIFLASDEVQVVEGEPEAAPAAVAVRKDDSVVLVPLHRMEEFEKLLGRLNAKAEKFGLEPITVLGREKRVYQWRTEHVGLNNMTQMLVPAPEGGGRGPLAEPVLLNRIELSYPTIRLGNWHVVGKLEAVDGGNLTFTVGERPEDRDAVARFAEHPIGCEHCGAQRRRVDSFILRDAETSGYKQVGSTCLQDFTGIDPGAALFLAKMMAVVSFDADDGSYDGPGRSNAVWTDEFLARVAFLTEHRGFVSSTKARAEPGLTPTYTHAMDFNEFLSEREGAALRPRWTKEAQQHFDMAHAIRQWVAEAPIATDFDRNLKLLLAQDVIERERKRLAIVAAAVPAYRRHIGMVAERARPSQHIGEVGQRMTTALTIERLVSWDNPYGSGETSLVLLRDQAGNRVKWKTSAAPLEVREGRGRTLEATFTVKEHSDYEGVAQTSVTRLKVERWLDAEMANGSMPASPRLDSMCRVAVYRHTHERPDDFREPVHEATVPFGRVPELAASFGMAHHHQPAAADPSAEITSLVSESNPGSSRAPDLQWFSLHVLEIDGREPTQDDYRALVTKLGELDRYQGLLSWAQRPQLHTFGDQAPTPEFHRWFEHGGQARLEPLTAEQLASSLHADQGYAVEAAQLAAGRAAVSQEDWDWFKERRLGALREPVEVLHDLIRHEASNPNANTTWVAKAFRAADFCNIDADGNAAPLSPAKLLETLDEFTASHPKNDPILHKAVAAAEMLRDLTDHAYDAPDQSGTGVTLPAARPAAGAAERQDAHDLSL